MGNLETKAALGYDIVQRQANGNKKNKTLKIKDLFMHSINYEVNKIKKELLRTYILMIELYICTNTIK
jgi:hypothetical protein